MRLMRMSDMSMVQLSDLYSSNPNTSFPSILTDETLSSFGYERIYQEDLPTFDQDLFYADTAPPTRIGGRWEIRWEIIPLPEEVRAANLKKKFETALDNHLDNVARQKRYDNRFTCALRAGYPGPFQAEGQAFAAWMDSCNAMAYQILFDVQQGLRLPPASIEEFIGSMPAMVWPN